MALRELSCLIEHGFYIEVPFLLHTFLDNQQPGDEAILSDKGQCGFDSS